MSRLAVPLRDLAVPRGAAGSLMPSLHATAFVDWHSLLRNRRAMGGFAARRVQLHWCLVASSMGADHVGCTLRSTRPAAAWNATLCLAICGSKPLCLCRRSLDGGRTRPPAAVTMRVLISILGARQERSRHGVRRSRRSNGLFSVKSVSG